jgi:CDP-diacylglycerol--glycerol-3-phosphate 3-phosphatidyltransferase
VTGGPDAPAGGRVGPAPLLNLANGLTALRLVLIPVFACLLVASELTRPGWRIAACAVFCAASITDYVDGWIARSWDQVTSFGKIADPIADKALTGTALVLLSAYGRLPWWVTGLVLSRELGVTLLRFWVIRHGVIPASRGGKAKTALQLLAITWYLFPFTGAAATVGVWIMAAALAVTLVTGGDYVARALRLRRAAGGRPAGAATAPVTGAIPLAVEPVRGVEPVRPEPVLPAPEPGPRPAGAEAGAA